jgi:hypothetical protein
MNIVKSIDGYTQIKMVQTQSINKCSHMINDMDIVLEWIQLLRQQLSNADRISLTELALPWISPYFQRKCRHVHLIVYNRITLAESYLQVYDRCQYMIERQHERIKLDECSSAWYCYCWNIWLVRYDKLWSAIGSFKRIDGCCTLLKKANNENSNRL